MSEFWIISNFLRQNSFENAELHELCKAVAVKYLENEKNDLRANSVREENVILQIDVGNLKQLYQSVAEVIEVQSASEALLSKYYDEQLKMAYDVDQQEKIYGYDEIKTELETRDSISMYEELYSRRIEMAKKMEERQIVKKYRHKEQDLLKSENDCLNIEQNLKAINTEAEELRATIQETILRLVKGSKELEITPTPTPSGRIEKRQTLGSLGSKTPDRNLFTKKPGLSSRLSIVFKPSKVPSAMVAPRIQTLNPTKGLDRLLQEAEILRKSMQTTPDDSPSIAKPSIISKDSKKEKTLKKVTFDLVTPEETPTNIESPPDKPKDSLEIINIDLDDTGQKAAAVTNSKCVILENIVIKPPGAPLPVKIRPDVEPVLITEPKVSSKRKIEQDHASLCASPQKKKLIDTEAVHPSLGIGDPKSFMDMFTDFSKDSTLEISSLSATQEEDMPSMSNVKEKMASDDAIEDRKQKSSFGGFEEFFASLTNATTENNNTDSPVGENTFDFFDTANGDNCEEDDYSFKF